MTTSSAVSYRANVLGGLDTTTKLRWDHGFDAYRLADAEMAAGSTLGNPSCQMVLKATGAIEKIFSVDAGSVLLGTFVLKHWDDVSGMKLDPATGHFFMYPEHQEHRYMLTNGVYVREDVFVLSRGPQEADAPIVYYVIAFANDTAEKQRIATYAFTELTATFKEALAVEYDTELQALVAHGKEKPGLARIVGCSQAPQAYEVSVDHAKAVTAGHPAPLSGETEAPPGLVTGILRFVTRLDAGERAQLIFRLGVSAHGTEELKQQYRSSPPAARALEGTRKHYRESLTRSIVMTPNDAINRGCMWAKANMERVLLQPPSGWSFTNSPLQSTKCVARDAAWFCAGADYFRPDFSRACLLQFVQHQKENGMIVEDYDMLDGKTQDYGLNINDDTPLFIWGVWHHFELTGDQTFLDEAFDAVVKAGRYIASQRNEQGLVWCTSQEFGSKGIVSWRNVIEGYRLSGAVTEPNAECYAAFRCVAALAHARDDEDTAAEFDRFATDLRAAIEKHLTNPGNGLYYLNIDVDGTPRSDITADLVFPVLFDVAAPEKAASIIERLMDRDFWTSGGMRAIPYDAVNYSPTKDSGCFGGVWNGMTFWFAKAAAAYAPDFMDEALTNGYQNYARDPRRNNTVPGQFSEWLHGETLVNAGMLLSPWFPPRYLWATIEGALGLDVSGGKVRLAPNMPSYWHWCGLRDLPLRGKSLTWFVARAPELRCYANGELDADFPCEVLDDDISERVQCSGDEAQSLGFASEGRVVAIVGNTSNRSITTALRIEGLTGDYAQNRFDSLARAWQDAAPLKARELAHGITLMVPPHGFVLFELTSDSGS